MSASLSGRLSKILLTGLGAVGGGTAVFLWKPDAAADTGKDPHKLAALETASVRLPISFSRLNHDENGRPSPDGVPRALSAWDDNWDHRQPSSLVEPPRNKTAEQLRLDDDYQRALSEKKARSRRHLLLVRHGQYNLDGENDEERYLTELGREQAGMTGRQLAALGVKYSRVVRSTMTRAVQTSDVIVTHLASDTSVISTDLLREGAPIPPEPSLHFWKPGPRRFYEDSARIEAAFRKFVHRAPPDQKDDSYEVIVCHANVIRYFVCRALQLPPEAWARISLRHASLTQLTVMASGRVKLDFLGDASFMPVEARTTT